MMNKLQQYFPMIRTKEEVLKEIENNSKLKEIYENWQEDEREEFLAFVTGTKGVKMMYDFISKAILNPEIYEERVEEFLSLLLQQKVKILEVLPNEETGLFGWVFYSDYGYRGRIRKRKYCQSGDTKEWLYVSGRTKCMLFSRFVIASIQKSTQKE